MTEGKLLGYVISKDEIFIDLERMEGITAVGYHYNKNTMQSFLGNINFVYRFFSGFVEIVKPLKNMIKKDAVFKWNHEHKGAF